MDQRNQFFEVLGRILSESKRFGRLGCWVSWDSVRVPNLFKALIERSQLFLFLAKTLGGPKRFIPLEGLSGERPNQQD